MAKTDGLEVLPAFQRYQMAFAAHLRDPRRHARPEGTSSSGMALYRELVRNNIDRILRGCFPITRRILRARPWRTLVRTFIAEFPCASPLFRHIPEDFVAFLRARKTQGREPAFLADFAHYEWIEWVVSNAPEEPDWSRIDPEADLMGGRPVLNPTLRVLQYPYPVHRIGPHFQPATQDLEPTRIAVFRDRQDTVRFTVINQATARLLEMLANPDLTGAAACRCVAMEIGHPNPDTVATGGQQALVALAVQGAVLGAYNQAVDPVGRP